MPHPAIRRALVAAVLTATAACANAQATYLTINPEAVNPLVMAAAISAGAIAPVADPPGTVPPALVQDYGRASAGSIPIYLTPPSAPGEIQIADVDLRMSILYVTDQAAKAILGGSTNMRNLPWLFRQEPSNSAGDAALGGNGTQRMWKISGSALAAKPTAAAMADMLKAAVNRRCVTPAEVNTCGANLVGVDEIGASFGTAPGESDEESPGALLRKAMTSLARQEFRPGVSYANRVHFYLAPGVITSISGGLGPKRTLGAYGKETRRNYSQVMSAMSRAGGVWLEMYHYPGRGKPRTPFTGAEWRDVPTRVATFMQEHTTGSRNPLDYMHFVLTDTPGAPPPTREPCRAPVSAGASSNSMVSDPGSFLDLLPECPAAPPPPCPVLQPKVGGAGSTSREARETSIMPNVPGSGGSGILNNARSSLSSVIMLRPINLAVLAPDDSGMTCQWMRAQGSTINTRILANGPGAFKVTGTEAEIFGQWFRTFFIVG
ncbi:MAG: hypothetical protein FJW92_01045 [Actinobacteria bacterium]|nr:hypothetical protein [Actinomycetota bacterium]